MRRVGGGGGEGEGGGGGLWVGGGRPHRPSSNSSSRFYSHVICLFLPDISV